MRHSTIASASDLRAFGAIIFFASRQEFHVDVRPRAGHCFPLPFCVHDPFEKLFLNLCF